MKGEGNQQDYGMRVYDPRIAKFLSVDPLSQKYPELTPYQFASNTPIWAIDIDGAEGGIPISYGAEGNNSSNYSSAFVKDIIKRVKDWANKPLSKEGQLAAANNMYNLTNGEVDIHPTKRWQYWASTLGLGMKHYGGSFPGSTKIRVPSVEATQTPRASVHIETSQPVMKAPTANEVHEVIINRSTVTPNVALPKMTVHEIEGNIIGGEFTYADGKVNQYIAYRNVTSDGKTLELTTFILYPKGAQGNELKNQFGRTAMAETLEALKTDAKAQGFDWLRIQFERAPNSSSAKPGKEIDKTFDLRKKEGQ